MRERVLYNVPDLALAYSPLPLIDRRNIGSNQLHQGHLAIWQSQRWLQSIFYSRSYSRVYGRMSGMYSAGTPVKRNPPPKNTSLRFNPSLKPVSPRSSITSPTISKTRFITLGIYRPFVRPLSSLCVVSLQKFSNNVPIKATARKAADSPSHKLNGRQTRGDKYTQPFYCPR